MKGKVLRSIGKTATDRVIGLKPGRMRSILAAMAAGGATAAVTYKLLRSGGDDDE
jgi:hypothetical protein